MKTRTIFPLLALAALLATAPAWGQEEAIPELNRMVLQFAADHQGSMVGDGESRTLVNEALKAAGARVQKLSENDTVLPGDVANFNQAKFVHVEGNGSSGTTMVVDDQHTAIVSRTDGPAITLLHQNFPVGHTTVDALTIDLLEQTEGIVEFFRPIPLAPANGGPGHGGPGSGPSKGGPGGGGPSSGGPLGQAQTPVLIPVLQRVTPVVIRRLTPPQITTLIGVLTRLAQNRNLTRAQLTTLIGVVRILTENPNLTRAQIARLIQTVRILLQNPNLTVAQRLALQTILRRLQARARTLAAGPNMMVPDEVDPDETDPATPHEDPTEDTTIHDPLTDDTLTCDVPPPGHTPTSNGGELVPPPPVHVVITPPGHVNTSTNSGTSNPPPVHPALCPPGVVIETFPPEPPSQRVDVPTHPQTPPGGGSSTNSGTSGPTPYTQTTIIDTFPPEPPQGQSNPPAQQPPPPGEASCGGNSGTSNPPPYYQPPTHSPVGPTSGTNSGTSNPPPYYQPPTHSPVGPTSSTNSGTSAPPLVYLPQEPKHPKGPTHVAKCPQPTHRQNPPPGQSTTIVDTKPGGSSSRNGGSSTYPPMGTIHSNRPRNPGVYSNPNPGNPGIYVTDGGPDVPPINIVKTAVSVVNTALPPHHPGCNKAEIRKMAKRCEEERRRQQAAAASHNVPRPQPAYASYPANGRNHIRELAQTCENERRRQEAIAEYNRRKAAWEQRQLAAYNTPAPMQHYDPAPAQQYYSVPMPQYGGGYGYDGYEPMDNGPGVGIGDVLGGIGDLLGGFGGGGGMDGGMDHDFGGGDE